MKPVYLQTVFHFLIVLVACSTFLSYLTYKTPRVVEYASPLRDNSENRVIKERILNIGESFTRFTADSIVKPFDGSWPWFRGEKRDNLSLSSDSLSSDSLSSDSLSSTWGEEGPAVLWRKTLGEGYAGAIIANSRVYVLDYLEKEESDALRCFSLSCGEELWRRSYRNPIRRNHGKSRTVPAFFDNVVVTFGPTAQVMAVDGTSGDLLWTLDIIRQYGGKVPQWYAGQCPLIEDGKVILGIGGTNVLIAAVDLHSGKVLWELPNTGGYKMSHCSVLSTELAGVNQYVYGALGGIIACDTKGNLLWECTSWKPAVWAPTPVKIAEEKLFLTAGYGAGSAVLAIKKDGNTFEAFVEKKWKPTGGPASEQQTPLVIDDTLIIIQPKNAGALRAELVAADVNELPEIKVSSGRQARFGLGPYIWADEALWIVDDEGVLHVYTYEDSQFAFQAKHKILPGVDSWGPIAYAQGLMIVRDSTSMVCLDLKKEVVLRTTQEKK